jgi:hypothetical protein
MKKYLLLVLGMFFILGITTMSWAGAELKISDETNAKFGFKGQIWAQSLDKAAADGTSSATDFDIRQLRLYGSGQIVPLVKFAFNIDAEKGFRDGSRTAKSVDTNITDANMTLDFSPQAKVNVGIFRTPFSRMAVTDSYTAYVFPHSPEIAGGGYVGGLGNFRNAGLTLWGDASGGMIKYGAGLFEGDLVPGAGSVPLDDAPFYSLRAAFCPLEPQKGYVFTQQYIGKAKNPVLTVGAGLLSAKYRTAPAATTHNTYSAWTADIYTEIPLDSGSLTVEVAYFDYNRGITNGKTNGYYAQAAYLIGGNIQPAIGYESSDRETDVIGGEDFTKLTAGINYYIKGHDAKINLEYASKDFKNGGTTVRTNKDFADITLALQFQF